jgi:hypothetical protein
MKFYDFSAERQRLPIARKGPKTRLFAIPLHASGSSLQTSMAVK